jgi:hypothetical protein
MVAAMQPLQLVKGLWLSRLLGELLGKEASCVKLKIDKLITCQLSPCANHDHSKAHPEFQTHLHFIDQRLC